MSFSASGLYSLNVIASPIPKSANDKIAKILVNRPEAPKYSTERYLMKKYRVTIFNKVDGITDM